MTASLANQPDDIILLIADIGELETSDALALRLVCKALYFASEHRSFWHIVAINVQRRHPLPLPPFRPMVSLSLEDIRTICLRNAHTSTNLHSPKPKCRASRIFPMENKLILNFAFLFGGRYGLITYEKGTVSVWDLHSVVDTEVAELVARDVAPSVGHNPTPVGILLAEFDTATPIHDLEYRTFGVEERKVVIATCSRSQQGRCSVNVFEFNFVSDFEVTTHRHYQTTATICVTTITLGPYGSVIFYGPRTGSEESARLFIVDYLQGHSTLISANGLPPDQDWYEMTVTDAGDLLLYKTAGRALEVFAYFDTRELPKAKLEIVALAPHATKLLPYSEMCWFSSELHVDNLYLTNTPNIRTLHQMAIISLMTTSLPDDGPTDWTFGIHWLSPSRLAAHLKGDAVADFLKPIHRTFHHIDPQVSQCTAGYELIAFGDSGRNAVWIREEVGVEEQQTRSLHLLPLQSPADKLGPEKLDLHEGVRILELPIMLEGAALVDLCDESGVVMVLVKGRTPEQIQRQCMYFFQY